MKYFFYALLIGLMIQGCKKDNVFTNSPVSLTFSTDSVDFDSIFTLKDSAKIGWPKSITLILIARNPNENGVRTTIQMRGNPYGIFKLNADGIAGSGNLQTIENIEIPGKDSIYIFIQTYINPLNFIPSEKFEVVDYIEFNTNGNLQSVVAITYPQDAHYFKSETLTGNITWNNDKPYVIYDDLLVDKNASLTINPGVKIYSHINSTIFVDGTINIAGTIDNPVVLQGSRLDDDYKEVSGQWNGIHLLSKSINNKVTGAVIKNGFIGIRVDSLSNNANPKLELKETIIQDMAAVGLLSYSSFIKAQNNLISDCGQFSFLGDLGGKYEFYFNTFVAIGTGARQNATFTLANTPYVDENGIRTVFPLSYDLKNNIIWGSNDDEINIVSAEEGITESASIIHCNIKSNVFRNSLIIESLQNQVNLDPFFVDASKKNYKLKGGSICAGKGIFISGIKSDLSGKAIRKNPPTIGAYELE
jgi:hypothetical protein